MTPPPGADPIQAMRDGVDRYGDVEPRAPLTRRRGPAGRRGRGPRGMAAGRGRASGPSARLPSWWRMGGGRPLQPSRHVRAPRPAIGLRRSVRGLPPRARAPLSRRARRQHRRHPLGLSQRAGRLRARRSISRLAGDSAGGNLAAAACIRLIDAGEAVPDRLALICAALDVAPPKTAAAGDGNVDAAGVAMMMSMYAPGVEFARAGGAVASERERGDARDASRPLCCRRAVPSTCSTMRSASWRG